MTLDWNRLCAINLAIANSNTVVFPLAVGALTTTFTSVLNTGLKQIDCIGLKYSNGNNLAKCGPTTSTTFNDSLGRLFGTVALDVLGFEIDGFAEEPHLGICG